MKADHDPIFSNANSYEEYVGRWSRLVAEQFVRWLDVDPSQTWLDVGAGTGILSQVILQMAAPSKILGIDLSEEYIAFARQHIHDERLEFRVGDAISMPFDAPQFDLAVSGLLLNFVASPEQAIQSMREAVKHGGIVAAYVWDYGGEMEMMRHFWDAAAIVDPNSSTMDAGQRFSICKPDNLRALFQAAHLQSIALMPIDIQTRFKNFDDYWLPFLGAQGSVSKYLRGLSDDTRQALREQLQTQLPIAKNGEIPLTARAWAIKAKR